MNQLGNETSPYLLQHADNPIWWHAWGDEAFKIANKEQKPIFLSIGYSTCYWCHFMEKDSFEKDDVAAILNEHFIAIKVDREERPDIDQIYMTALVAMRGQGGWPISMFLLPDGTPFFGASTIPHDKFMDILGTIQFQWEKDHGQFLSNSAIIRDQLSTMMTAKSTTALDTDLVFKQLNIETKSNFDSAYKGFGSGTKFPNPHQYHILLRRYLKEQDPQLLRIVTESLDAMAKGGIHDHIDGGFHRYSVDTQWNVPHFEKMLYDQAGLISIYLEAYHMTKQDHYKKIAEKTLDFCIKNMRQEDGGFISAFDAGELHKEGEYYAWTENDIDMALSKDDLAYFYTKMDMALIEKGKEGFAIRIKQSVNAEDFYADKKIQNVIRNLGFFRNERPVPHKDDKVITAWNGMMIHSLAKAYQITQNVSYLETAQETALFLKQHLTASNQHLYRSWRDHTVSAEGTVDDYAFLIQGLLTLYESDGDPIWYNWANDLQVLQNSLFLDKENGGYFMDNGKDTTLFTRPKEFTDMAMASGNSVSALNLLRFSHYGEHQYKSIATTLFNTVSDTLNTQPSMYSYMALAIDFSESPTKELVVIGSNSDIQATIKKVHRSFRPYVVTAYSTEQNDKNSPPIVAEKTMLQNKVTYYVCNEGTCNAPTTDLETALSQLKR